VKIRGCCVFLMCSCVGLLDAFSGVFMVLKGGCVDPVSAFVAFMVGSDTRYAFLSDMGGGGDLFVRCLVFGGTRETKS
jgi:hypothetical protein